MLTSCMFCPPHGWSTCILYTENQMYEMTISHVFGDPIRDFIEATIALLKGISTVEFTWWREPGGNRWKMTRNPDASHKVKITVTDFPTSYGDLITQEEILVEFEIKISQFSTLVYYQVKKIASLLREKSFEKNRSSEFPYSEFCKLEALCNIRAINSEL